jgi:uncharacterized protein (TIRG00374 family)
MKLVLAVLRTALGVALLAFVLQSTGGWTAVRRFFEVWWLLPLVSLFPFFAAVLEAARLRILSRSQGIEMEFGPAFKLVSVSTLFNFAVPGGTGGDVMKLYYLGAENRGRLIEVATILIADRAIALFMLLFVVLGLAALNVDAVASSVILQGLVGIAAVMFAVPVVVGTFALSPALRGNRIYRWLVTEGPMHEHVRRLSDAVRALVQWPRTLFEAMGLTLLGHVTLVAMFGVLASVLVPDAPPVLVGLLSLLGMLANAVPITPGGLGVGEAAFDRLFAHMGYGGGALLLLAWRLGVIALAVVGFGFYSMGLKDISRRGDLATHGGSPSR